MGNQVRVQEQAEEMTPVRAIALALQKVVPHRGVLEAVKITGISHSSLLRLMKGQQRGANVAVIEKLRRYPGFSAEFDRLMEAGDSSPEYAEVARRLSAIFGTEGAERIVYQLESLARYMNADGIVNLLKSQVKILSDMTR